MISKPKQSRTATCRNSRNQPSKPPDNPYRWQDCLLFYKGQVVIPPHSRLIHQPLQAYHDSPLGRHSGALRTYKRLAQQFYWPSMRKTVQEYVGQLWDLPKKQVWDLGTHGITTAPTNRMSSLGRHHYGFHWRVALIGKGYHSGSCGPPQQISSLLGPLSSLYSQDSRREVCKQSCKAPWNAQDHY